MNENFHCCMDCGPDVVATCKAKGCQVEVLVMEEERAVQERPPFRCDCEACDGSCEFV